MSYITQRHEGVTIKEYSQEEYAIELEKLAKAVRDGKAKINESIMDVPAKRLLLIFANMDQENL